MNRVLVFLREFLIVFALIFAACYETVFFGVPYVLSTYLPQKVYDEYGVTMKVGGVRIDPLSAYAEVKDFSMTHKGEKVPILSFADLKFDFSYYSATKRAAIIDKIELNGFFANLKRDGEKKFNIEKIFLKNKTEKSGEPLYFSINNIKITNSALELSDEITGAKVSAKNLNINIPFVSTIPYDTEIFITPGFDGVINGTKLKFFGKTRPFAKDLKSELFVALSGFRLLQIEPFLPKSTTVNKIDGVVDLVGTMSFEKKDSHPLVSLKTDLNVSDFSVNTDGQDVVFEKLTVKHAAFNQKDLNGSVDSIRLDSLAAKLPDTVKKVGFENMEISKVSFNPAQKTADLKDIDINGLSVSVYKPKNGQAGGGKPKKTAGRNDSKPWSVTVSKLSVNGEASYKDELFLGKKPYEIKIKPIELTLRDLSTGSKNPFSFDVKASSSEGNIGVSGRYWVSQKAFKCDFNASKLRLTTIDTLGFMPPTLRLISAEAFVDGSVSGSFQKDITADANISRVSVNNFSIFEGGKESRLLAFDTLYAKGVKASYPPKNGVKIEGASLSGFFANIKIDENKSINIQKHFAGQKSDANNSKGVKKGETAKAEKIPFELGGIALQGGRIEFEDRSLKKRFKTTLTDVAGSIGKISVDKNETAAIDLRANSGGYGRIALKGGVNPSGGENFALKLKASTIDLPMAQFTPYTEKFIGYKIASGNLGLDLDYQIYGRKLESSNKISLFGFNLGDEVESPGAVKLPYKLAIAILKDDRGNIDIELPVEGSLDDPEIKSGAVVWKLIKQLIFKIIKSPFSAIAGLFGGSDELSFAGFMPGLSTLDNNESEKLKKIAEAAAKKPNLNIVLTGFIDGEKDISGYKRATFEAKVAEQKRKDLKLPVGQKVKVEEGEYLKYLKAAYSAESFAKPKNMLGFDKELSKEDMRSLMITHVTADEKKMTELLSSRVKAVYEGLVAAGVAKERIKMSEPVLRAPEIRERVPSSRVEITLAQ